MASVETRRNKDGKVTSYRVRWRTGGKATGKPDSERFDRLSDARSFAATVTAHGDRRPDDGPLMQSARAGQLTVAALVEGYIVDREKRVRSDRTTADYRRDLRNWIEPAFGRMAARELTSALVQEWVDGMPKSPKTVSNVHGILSAAYKWGILGGQVLANPCAGTQLPHAVKKTKRGLRPGEWTILYDAAVEIDQDAADLLLFLVGTGWRWSEATALQVMHCDLDGDVPTVEVARVHRRNAAGENVLVDDAKSTAGLRVVRLFPMLADMLRERVAGKALGDYVFATTRGGAWRYSNFHDRRWKPIVAKARENGLAVEPTIHWLRHTQVALLIEQGGNLPAIQRRIGHESITTTVNTYGRLVDDVPAEVLGKVQDALFKRTRPRAVKSQTGT